MSSNIELTPVEIIAQRPFTHPKHTTADTAVLRATVDKLCLVLEQPDLYAHLSPPPVLHFRENGRFQRFALVRPARLQQPKPTFIVGFFGQLRQDVDTSRMDPLDEDLVAELPRYAAMLAYCTSQLPNGNYGNLVVFDRAEGKQHWSKSRTHAKAVEMAPDMYWSVRIYNGRLPHGVMAGDALELHTVKYYDYREQPVWRAVRRLAAA